MRWFCVNLFTFFLCSTSFAQQPLYTYQQWFKVEDGLPQSFISGVLQDQDGFIWISTLDGLARYDGRTFKIFRQQPGDSNSLSSNVIVKMMLTSNNRLAIVYQGNQLDELDPRTFQIIHSSEKKSTLEAIAHSNRARIYNYTGKFWNYTAKKFAGIKWANSLTGEVGVANTKNGKLKNDTIVGLTQNRDDSLWIITTTGIQVTDKRREQFSFIPFLSRIPLDTSKAYPNRALLLPDHSLAFSHKNQIYILDPSQRTVSVTNVSLNDSSNVGSQNILNMQTDNNGRLCFEFKGRIFRLEKDNGLTLLWQNKIASDRRIPSFFIDQSDVLWVGIDAGGLVRVNLRSMPFQSYSYLNNFHTDIVQRLGIPIHQLPAFWQKTKNSYSFRYAYGSDSTLFFSNTDGTDQQTALYAWKNNQLSTLPFPTNRRKVSIRGITTGKDGEVWASDQHNAGEWYWKNRYAQPVFYPYENGPVQNLYADLLQVGQDQWLSSYGNGLFRYRDGKLISQFEKMPSVQIPYDLTDLCKDPADPNKFWIGSMGGGLILWDAVKGLEKTFTTNDGLPNNTIYAIIPDAHGMLWLSTNKGICRFDPVQNTVYPFEKSDGLAGNEFNRFHFFNFPDGRIAFGGPEGYTIFQPADFRITRDSLPVTVQFTEIQINNELQEYNTNNKYLSAPYSQLQELKLPYNKNYLSFSFAALQFNEPQKIKYRYKLSGVDAGWIDAGNNNAVRYSQLSPGNYTLEVNATQLNGQWSSFIRKLNIHIRPPIWATWWAYLFYALLALALLRAYIIYRERRLREQQLLIFEQREAERLREMDQVKDRFFANLTHEFRTPLTLILAPLEKIDRDYSISAPVKQSLSTIRRNAAQLLRLINQLLDLSKSGSGQMQVNLSTGELSLFFENCLQQFTQPAAEKNIELLWSVENIQGLYSFDEEKWEKIIVNLVNNALKFTGEGGTIQVKLENLSDNMARLTVQDNGPGIPEHDTEKVFERFYQVDSSATRGFEGSGIGLALVKELTQLMKGSIQLISKAGKGALFVAELPAYPAEKNNLPASIQLNDLHLQTIPVPKNDHSLVEKPRILIAEDNQELRLFLAESLSANWNILQAADGITTWDIILAEMPDLVISDVMMPGRDGFELCRLCKNDKRTAHIGFMLLTSRAAHPVKLEGLETGADDYITKPFHLDELELRIYNMLQAQERLRNHLQSQALPQNPVSTLPTVSDQFVRELYQQLDEKLDDPQLNVDYLSKMMGMSRSSLNRKLKTLLDISANDLIRRYRLQKASALLAAGHDIASTAYKVGFNTPSYFTQCFKEQYGITPSEYTAGGA